MHHLNLVKIKSLWIPSKQSPNTCTVGWANFIISKTCFVKHPWVQRMQGSKVLAAPSYFRLFGSLVLQIEEVSRNCVGFCGNPFIHIFNRDFLPDLYGFWTNSHVFKQKPALSVVYPCCREMRENVEKPCKTWNQFLSKCSCEEDVK